MSTRTAAAVNMDTRSGLKLLSLDAGGAQAISQLQILGHLMEKVSNDNQESSRVVVKRPCEVFDAIGGTGTGGLIAIFFVVLKMTAKEALEEFTKFAVEVYKETDRDPYKQTEKLKRVIYDILERRGMDKDRSLIMENEPVPSCRLIVPIMYKNNVGITCVLRNHVIRQEPPTNLTVAEAMLATSATSPSFAPISIGKDFATFEYVSGDLGLSNPVREVIAGAHHSFGDEATVACLLSVGCGHPGVTQVPSTSDPTARIDFLEQLAMDSEKVAKEIATQMSQLTLYHRIFVSYGLEKVQSRAWLEPESIAAHTTVYLNDLELAKSVDSCVDAINTGYGSATLEQLRHSGGARILPPALPPLNPSYVERKAAMDFIEKALFDQDRKIKLGSKRIVVTGIGGCGKTQLARKLVENHRDRFISTFIVDGSSRDSLRRDIVRHVRSLDAAHSQDSFEESMVFLSQPIPEKQRLLIIDNIDDPSLDLAPFLPRWTDGVVIVTSRNVSRDQLSPSAHLQLEVMSLEESVELLVRGSGREWPALEADKEEAVSVANELGCHPIALVQATSYMSSTGYSAVAYISRLRSYREQLLKDPATNQLDMRYLTAFAAFDASYDILPLSARNTLHLLSFFERHKFPLELITLAAENDFSAARYNCIPHGEEFKRGKECLKQTFCPSGEWNHLEMDSIITGLRNQSLITLVPAMDFTLVEMHSLVHEWSRLRVSGANSAHFQAAAVRLLCCGAGDKNYRMMQYLSSHVMALSSKWENLDANDAASFGFILGAAGLYANAAKLKGKAYELVKRENGTDHPHTIAASASLAATYSHLGRYNDAEELQVQVLRQRKRLLGTKHPQTITASASLAATYHQLGHYADAEELEVQVLRQRKRLLGPEHPDTISACENLAITYSQLGRYADAEVLQIQVLRQRKRLLGPEHPDTITASANLANTYGSLGRYADAEELEVQVLRQRKRLLGTGHPHTIEASASLAVTYSQLGRYANAEELELQVLRERKRLLGTDHPDTITASANLAATYGESGRHVDAEELQVQVLRQRRRLLGLEHPFTINASANLANTYGRLGRHANAEELEVQVLGQQKRLLGTDHPDTIDASANLAATYGRLGRYADAELLEVLVLRQQKRLLGPEHPHTITASATLANTYGSLGRYADAEELQVQVLRQQKRLLGPEHPFTINASAGLAVTYSRLGCHAKAEELKVQVLRQRKQLLGTDHPDTIEASASLAATYGESGRHADAEEPQVQVLRQRRRLLGMEHPNAIRASADLAATYGESGRYADAEELQVQVVSQRKRLLGPEHPDTIRACENLAITYSQLGRYADAKALQADVVRLRTTIMGSQHPDTLCAMKNLGIMEERCKPGFLDRVLADLQQVFS